MISEYKGIFINLQSIAENSFETTDFLEFAEKIKGKYKLYLISDNDVALQLPFTEKFIGAELGHRLPSLELFDKALEMTRLRPAECIYIDGDITNLHSAEEVGMAPILFYRGGNRYYDSTVYSFEELSQLL